eukprot:CAMPEP_0197639582 /NCGR_PEP_ID=MMETSP1338-20131121/14164_1 /TAXON_ID=43686 ORGANISM="Pelagodinium beii, Strain RCC1491" /NCGR_SAMPLE_ID=MMETSP1338 /ASSEMBLY_ACC=CAM_ASM_000754 /LENGTH=292 /DNA_ID=CAMNT_0043212329 /DNA_START=82 /DNA_END=960 /DNA_ORIENTATION=+
MCKFFLSGACERGAACGFAHSSEELKAAPDLSKTKLCPTLVSTGRCNEQNCSFAHSKDELRARPEVPPEVMEGVLPVPPTSRGKFEGRKKREQGPRAVGLQCPDPPAAAPAGALPAAPALQASPPPAISGLAAKEVSKGRSEVPRKLPVPAGEDLDTLYKEVALLRQQQGAISEALAGLETRIHAVKCPSEDMWSEPSCHSTEVESASICTDPQSSDMNFEDFGGSVDGGSDDGFERQITSSEPLSIGHCFGRAVSDPEDWACSGYMLIVRNSFLDVVECGSAMKRSSSSPP